VPARYRPGLSSNGVQEFIPIEKRGRPAVAETETAALRDSLVLDKADICHALMIPPISAVVNRTNNRSEKICMILIYITDAHAQRPYKPTSAVVGHRFCFVGRQSGWQGSSNFQGMGRPHQRPGWGRHVQAVTGTALMRDNWPFLLSLIWLALLAIAPVYVLVAVHRPFGHGPRDFVFATVFALCASLMGVYLFAVLTQ
jgi:hypothetical protein